MHFLHFGNCVPNIAQEECDLGTFPGLWKITCKNTLIDETN